MSEERRPAWIDHASGPNKVCYLGNQKPISEGDWHRYFCDTGTLRETVKCKKCKGKGQYTIRIQSIIIKRDCLICDGTGRRVKK